MEPYINGSPYGPAIISSQDRRRLPPYTLEPLSLEVQSEQLLPTLCNATTAHILNRCPETLIQGRFTWRHDSVLNCLVPTL